MKKIIISAILFSLIMISTMQAQQNGVVTLTKSFKTFNAITLNLDLNGEFAVEPWDHDYVKIEMQIKDNIGNPSILRYLNSAGRFDIKYSRESFATAVVSMPNLRKIVTVNRKVFTEEITYKIFTPKNMIISDLFEVDQLLVQN